LSGGEQVVVLVGRRCGVVVMGDDVVVLQRHGWRRSVLAMCGVVAHGLVAKTQRRMWRMA